MEQVQDTPKCRRCDVDLVSPDNWRPFLAKRDSRICSPCRRADEVRYLKNSPERREKMRLKSAQWRKENPERYLSTIKRWNEAHPDYAKNKRKERKEAAEKNSQ